MDYVFQVNGCPPGDWTQQVALALEKRTALYSREKLPVLWRLTDRLGTPNMPEPVLKRRRIRSRIYGVILVLLGLFLLIPGLIEPQTLKVPLFAGLFATMTGILQMLPRRKHPVKRYLRTANSLLAHRQTVRGTAIRFDEKGIVDGDSSIAFAQFDSIIEGPDLYFLAWGEKGMILWKQELTGSTPEAFSAFLSAHHTVTVL